MTPSGEMMMRTRAVCCVGPASRKSWRNSRAENLARMIAWHRRHQRSAGEPELRRIVLEDIVPDIGWPKLSWLKLRVREIGAEIAVNLAEAARLAAAFEDAGAEGG